MHVAVINGKRMKLSPDDFDGMVQQRMQDASPHLSQLEASSGKQAATLRESSEELKELRVVEDKRKEEADELQRAFRSKTGTMNRLSLVGEVGRFACLFPYSWCLSGPRPVHPCPPSDEHGNVLAPGASVSNNDLMEGCLVDAGACVVNLAED